MDKIKNSKNETSNFESATPEQIGEFIKNLRTEKGLNQAKFAKKVGVVRQTVSNWELGKSDVDYNKATLIASVLNVHVLEILLARKLTLEEINEKINESYKKANKLKKQIEKTIKISIAIFVLLILLFFLYYFFNSYNSIKFYYIQLKNENYTDNEGIFFVSKDFIYFDLDLKDENIKNITLKYTKDNEIRNVLTTDSSRLLINDLYGYESYFKFEDIINNKATYFIEIENLDDSHERIDLQFEKNYENKKIFFSKKEKISDGTKTDIKASSIPLKIQEKLKLDESNYKLEIKDDEKNIYLNYNVDTESFFVTEEYKKYTDSWTYNIDSRDLFYTRENNKNEIIEEKIINQEKDHDLYQYFLNNYIIVYIE